MNEDLKEAAEEYAQKMWGTYFDNIDENSNWSRGDLSIKDFIAGIESAYNQRHSPAGRSAGITYPPI